MSNSETTEPTEPSSEPRTSTGLPSTGKMKFASIVTALLGLYLVVSPFIIGGTDAGMWNGTLVGAVVFLLAAYNFVRLSQDRLASVGISSLTVLLGLWLFVSPELIAMGDSQLASGTSMSGLLITVLAAYVAYTSNNAETPERSRART